MKLRLLLAHHAEVQAGMVYLLGAGWTEIGPDPSAFAIAGLVEIPWEETNRQHELDITIVDAVARRLHIRHRRAISRFASTPSWKLVVPQV